MNFKFITVICICLHAVSLSVADNKENDNYFLKKKMSRRQLLNDLFNSFDEIKQKLPSNLIDSNSIDYIKYHLPSDLVGLNSTDNIQNLLPNDIIDYAKNHIPSDLGGFNSTDFIQNLLPAEFTGSIDELKNELIMLFIEKASQLNFLNIFTNYLASLGVNLNFVDPNLVQITFNASQYINITIDENLIYKNWVYINKTFSFNVPDDFRLLILTQCFRSDGKKLMWNQYWIRPIDLYVYSFNLVDYIQLNADLSYNCLFNYSYISTTLNPINSVSTNTNGPITISALNFTSSITSNANNITTTAGIPISLLTSTNISYSTQSITTNPTGLEVVSLELSLNLTFVNDYYNLSSRKSVLLIGNLNLFLNNSFTAAGLRGFQSVIVDRFLPGSIIVNSKLYFQSINSSNTTTFLDNIKSAIVANKNDSNIPAVDPNLIIISLSNPSTPTTKTTQTTAVNVTSTPRIYDSTVTGASLTTKNASNLTTTVHSTVVTFPNSSNITLVPTTHLFNVTSTPHMPETTMNLTTKNASNLTTTVHSTVIITTITSSINTTTKNSSNSTIVPTTHLFNVTTPNIYNSTTNGTTFNSTAIVATTIKASTITSNNNSSNNSTSTLRSTTTMLIHNTTTLIILNITSTQNLPTSTSFISSASTSTSTTTGTTSTSTSTTTGTSLNSTSTTTGTTSNLTSTTTGTSLNSTSTTTGITSNSTSTTTGTSLNSTSTTTGTSLNSTSTTTGTSLNSTSTTTGTTSTSSTKIISTTTTITTVSFVPVVNLNLKLSLNLTFESDYYNLSSAKSILLIRNYILFLNNSFKESNLIGFESVIINSFTPGSVVVNSSLVFQSLSPASNISNFINSIKSAIVANKNDPNIPAVDPNSISISLANSSSSISDNTKLALAIALPIAGCLFLFVVIISILFCRYRHNKIPTEIPHLNNNQKKTHVNQLNLMKNKPAFKHIGSGTFSNYRTGYNMDQVSNPLDEREFLNNLENRSNQIQNDTGLDLNSIRPGMIHIPRIGYKAV